MERSVAVKKLGKLLGKNLGYRVDPKAPDQDERDEARAKLKLLAPEREAVDKQKNARMREILEADPEYQRLKTAYAELKNQCDNLLSKTCDYRFTVGISNSMFFHIKAQGDSWEEVIAKIESEKP